MGELKKYLFLLLFISFFVIVPENSLADSYDYTVMESLPGLITAGNSYTAGQYILSIYKIALWVVGISALLMISIGAFMYITSAGNNASMQTAKGVITDAIIGLILAFLAWLILYIINPDLVIIKAIDFGGNTGTTTTTTTPTTGNGSITTQVPGQRGDASEKLEELLTCIQKNIPSGQTMDISSISDGNGGVNCYKNHPNWSQCSGNTKTNCCFHKKGSCHYGGTCGGSSYAVDFSTRGSSLSRDEMISLAKDCNANYTKDEGNHIHVSVGADCGCK